ncbi:hypothetical protein J6590_085325 [Homalodisca vitripennis]|nr:hypothetical protein J6590_095775 [Homalodisca vitripennis]KAG8300072.1 hypothetical protein J6590_085325 [Homalodisca vitripennis]
MSDRPTISTLMNDRPAMSIGPSGDGSYITGRILGKIRQSLSGRSVERSEPEIIINNNKNRSSCCRVHFLHRCDCVARATQITATQLRTWRSVPRSFAQRNMLCAARRSSARSVWTYLKRPESGSASVSLLNHSVDSSPSASPLLSQLYNRKSFSDSASQIEDGHMKTKDELIERINQLTHP